MDHVTITTPLWGTVFCQWVGIVTINLLRAKFEVSTFTHYEDIKVNKKCEKIWWFGRLGVTQSHRHHSHSIECIWLPIQLYNKIYASIFYWFQVIASYLSKVADLTYPTCVWHPHKGMIAFKFCHDLWHQKTIESWAIVWHYLHDPTFSHFDMQSVTDRQKDTRRWHDILH